jgi:hypothetical protein
MSEMERSIKMSDDIVMEDVYAKLAKAREKKVAAKQEQVADKKHKYNDRKLRWGAEHKSKSNASNRKSYNKKKQSKAPSKKGKMSFAYLGSNNRYLSIS